MPLTYSRPPMERKASDKEQFEAVIALARVLEMDAGKLMVEAIRAGVKVCPV